MDATSERQITSEFDAFPARRLSDETVNELPQTHHLLDLFWGDQGFEGTAAVFFAGYETAIDRVARSGQAKRALLEMGGGENDTDDPKNNEWK